MVAIPVLRKEHAAREFMREAWQRAREGGSPSIRLCPHCQKNMSLAEAPVRGHSVALDLCTQCQCVWFDPGEYDEVPRQQAPVEEQLSPKAREAVALAKVKSIERQCEAETGGLGPDEPWKVLPAVLGLPVECNVPPIACRPWVTWGLSAIVAAVLLATWGSLEAVINDWGFIPSQWQRQHGATLIAAFFLHAGLWHVVGNLYFLIIFGDNVEDDLGRPRFIALLAIAHAAGLIAHAMLEPRSDMPCVGASAGISGVIAYYAVAFPRAQLGLMWRYWFVFRWVRLPAAMAFVLWIGLQMLLAYIQIEGVSSVSALAHLGGAAVGLAMAITLHIQRRATLRRG